MRGSLLPLSSLFRQQLTQSKFRLGPKFLSVEEIYFDGFSFIDFRLCAHIFNYKQPLSPLKIYQHKLPKDNQILQIELRGLGI
jgi:hypothetical protein